MAYHAVTVKLRGGRTLRGIAKNESPFDLQLLATDGKLYLLSKAQIAEIPAKKPSCRKVEASPAQVRNLVAYLSRLVPDPGAKATLASGGIGAGVPFADDRPPQAGRMANVPRRPERQPLQPARPDQHRQRAAPGAGAGCSRLPGARARLEVTPVVVDGVMYVTAVNEAYALDARTGREIWHYSRPRSQGLAGDAAGGINRGVAVLGDRVFMVTDNAHLIALHRLTGQLLWDVEMADSHQNYGSTSAPLVVNDLVIAGISGGDEGVRGFLAAYKASTGEHVWRFWTMPAPGEPGSETWGGRAIEHGCGSTWLTGTYDPETNLLYWPTGNPCPDYNGDERKGDNLYTGSVLALDPATGKLRWYYQFTPHDLHDWDATETPDAGGRRVSRPAAQAAAAGQSQRLLLRARPAHRQGAAGRAVRQEADLGQRHRPGRAPQAAARQRPDRGRHAGLPVGGRRRQLAVRRLQSRDRAVLHVRARNRATFTARTTSGGRPASRSTAAARAARPDENEDKQIPESHRHPDRQDRLGDPGRRRRHPGQRPDGDCGRPGFLWR